MTPYIFLDYYTTCNNLIHHIFLFSILGIDVDTNPYETITPCAL